MVVASGGLILGWGLRWWQVGVVMVDGGWWMVVTMGLVGWGCYGLGWLVATVGL